MGTSLTGTKPKDTYDSLIKVTDNGPLSGTAKYLSDGLGNDSALAVSTAQVGVGTTTLGTNYPLTVRSATADYTKMLDWGTGAGGSWGNMSVNVDAPYETILTSSEWAFKAGGTEKVRILASGGITFNGDTAAANALDDYEEGTFTATMKGSVSDPTTPVTTTAYYTKIGRQVTVSFSFISVNTTGAAGAVTVSGLPFVIGVAATGAVTTEFFDFGGTRTSVASFAGAGGSIINFFATGDDLSFDNLVHNAGTGRFLYTSITYFV